MLDGMGSPYLVLAGATYLITRRCSQRTFRLLPKPETINLLKYCLALAATRTGVRLHALCVMADHYHLVATDADGILPKFLHLFHLMSARALNALQEQRENMWSNAETSRVRLEADADVIDKIAYVAANPVAAGLVEQPEQYPGIIRWQSGVEIVKRPEAFFSESGACPDEIELCFVEPPARGNGRTNWPVRVHGAIRAAVRAAYAKVRASGRDFLGATTIHGGSIMTRATSPERKCGVVPRVASNDPALRRALLAAESAFQSAYGEARALWECGIRDVVFPFGTWALRVYHAAFVAAAPAACGPPDRRVRQGAFAIPPMS